MRIHRLIIPAVLILAAAAPAGAAAAPAAHSAAARQFEGTVVSVNTSARTFRLRDAERGTVQIRVTRSTSFERLSGFGALRAGLGDVEATVRRANGRWVALHVERSGGGGHHGGDD
jgi:hypothetical protein